MSNESRTGQVVYTNKAHCRDCYRCLRVCPVKAIRMENGQAYVVPERCISCGTCIRECPQGAKQYRNDLELAMRLLESGKPVAASIAPSFVAVFSESEQKRLASGLRKLGFAYVGETAIGAHHVAVETAKFCQSDASDSYVCTACPAIVSYVELYQPDILPALVPVVSPMLAHAKHIKRRLPKGSKVIFIGPCVAKKAEADRAQNAGIVDCVLTFSELLDWFARENVNLAMCEESNFDEEPGEYARLFPLVGGSIRTGGLCTDTLAADIISASGFNEVIGALADVSESTGTIVEPLFCQMGCINGPAMPAETGIYTRRREVLDYAASHVGTGHDNQTSVTHTDLIAKYAPAPLDTDEHITEEQIRAVLDHTGKASDENQLNCGACGYPTCRDKAVAVIRGMAELDMCLPYVKRLAEQRTDRIIETSPNGIVILDEHLNIIHMNPAFRSFFMCSEAVLGRPISYLMDPDPFEKLAAGKADKIETMVRHDRYNLVCHEIVYKLEEENQYVGILVNITKSRINKEKLDSLRSQTVLQAKELLDHQVNMAQTLAKFLGESTAQSESLLDRLMLLADDQSGDNDGNDSIWDIYTSK